MSDRTSIEWTDASWNPIRANARGYGGKAGNISWHCEHVSEGCRNCYAEGINRRLGNGFEYKPGKRGALDIFIDEKTLLQPLKWKKPRMIFACSMTDLFADFVTDEMIDRVFAVMALAHGTWRSGQVHEQHTFQVLTKRSARMLEYMAHPEREAFWMNAVASVLESDPALMNGCYPILGQRDPWLPLPNVWLGVSAEDQKNADERIPDLLATPAAVRFVSLEPLLGAIDLTAINQNCCLPFPGTLNAVRGTLWPSEGLMDVGVEPMIGPRLDWVIVGGESGPKARPMHPDWARSLRDQCRSAEVPFFFKQWGAFAPTLCDKLPVEMIRVGKSRAGRLLDGIEHNGMPAR